MADVVAEPDLDHVELLAAEGAALIEAVRRGPLEAPVAACPGWSVEDVARHIGTTWRWAAAIVNERATAPMQPADEPLPASDAVVGWLEEGLVRLLDALRSCPPDTPVWGFGPRPRTEAFWRRRQAMETVVHRVDAELATGECGPISPAAAADGVGEFLEVMLPRMHRGQEPPAGQLQLRATDVGGQWSAGDPAGGIGTLEGRAADLFLSLWQREGGGPVTVGGEQSVAEGWRKLGAP